MEYTTSDALNHIIRIAIDEGIVSEEEIRRIIESHGTDDSAIVVDVLSIVYQRRDDESTLREMQRIFRNGIH